MNPVFTAESICKSYGAKRVLTAARVALGPGTLTVLVGRNGAGKSTLMRICSGALPADQGVIRLGAGVWARAFPHTLARHGMFFIPDHGMLSPAVSLRAHFAAVGDRFGRTRSVDNVAEQLEIDTHLDELPHRVSSAVRRRAELGLALMRRPKCLLADEPMRGADPKERMALLSFLRYLADSGCAVLVTGQEMAELLGTADSVIWVTSGTTYGLGSGGAAASHERFRRECLTGTWGTGRSRGM